MTRAEVEAIVGLPPGRYDDAPPGERSEVCFDKSGQFGEDQDSWVSNGGVLGVAYNPDGTVCGKIVEEWEDADKPPLLDRVRRLFGW
jgi:hypothetical protein